MAQTETDELLNSIKAEYQLNSEMFGKALTDINSKLEDIAHDSAAAELMNTGLQDLTAELGNRHRFISEKFENIKDSFEILNQNQDLLVKNSDLKIMFNILNENVDHFAHELSEQQALISDMESKFTEFRNDTSRKDEIIQNVSVVKEGIDEVNRGLQASIMEVNSNLRGITKTLMTMDATEQNDIMKRELENIYLAANAVLSSIQILDQKNDGLAKNIVCKDDLINLAGKIDNSFAIVSERIDSYESGSVEDTKKILAEIEKCRSEFNGFNENIVVRLSEYLNSVRDVLANCIDEIKQSQALSNIESDSIARQKFENLEKLSGEIKNIDSAISTQNDTYIGLVNDKIKELGSVIGDFKTYFTEIHAGDENALQIKFDSLDNLLAQGNAILQDKFSELQVKVENAVSIINQFAEDNNIKLGNSLSEISDIKSEISRILDNMTSFNSHQDAHLTHIDGRLEGDFAELKNNLNGFCSSFEALKYNLEQSNIDNRELLAEIVESASAKTREIVQNLANSSGENAAKTLNMQMEFLQEQFNDLKNVFTSIAAQNVQNILSVIENAFGKVDAAGENLAGKFDEKFTEVRDLLAFSGSENKQQIAELGDRINAAAQFNTGNIISGIETVSSKIDMMGVDLSTEIDNNFEMVRDFIEKSNADKDQHNADITALSDCIKILETEFTNNTEKFKNVLTEQMDSLDNYISVLKECNSKEEEENPNTEEFNKLNEKMLAIETAMHEAGENFSDNLMMVQNKIADYAHALDAVSDETGEKLDNSLIEISSVKFELVKIFETLSQSGEDVSSKVSETLKDLIVKFEDIAMNVTDIKSDVNSNITSSIQENSAIIEEKFFILQELLNDNNLRNFDRISECDETLRNKIEDLKQEIGLINTDITDIITARTESLTYEFAPLKEAIDKFLNEDFDKIIDGVKSQIELSYLNFSADVNENLTENHDNYVQLNEAYQTLTGKFALVEEVINDLVQNQIGIMTSTIEKVEYNVANSFDKNNEIIQSWKDDLQKLENKLDENSRNAQDLLSGSLKEFSEDFKTTSTAAKDEIISNIGALELDLISQMDSIKEDYANGREKLDSVLNALNEKVDILALSDTSSNIEELVGSLREKIDAIADTESDTKLKSIESALDTLSSKIDILALSDDETALEEVSGAIQSINDKLSDFSAKIENSKQNELEKLLNILNDKIDIIALSDDNTAAEEIEGVIKSLHEKIDILALSDSDSKLDELEDVMNSLHAKLDLMVESSEDTKLDEIGDSVKSLHAKLDLIVESSEESKLDEIDSTVKNLNDKIDVLAISDDNAKFEELEDVIKSLHDKFDLLAESEDETKLFEIEDSIKSLHEKFDLIVETDDNSKLEKIDNAVKTLHEKMELLSNSSDVEKLAGLENIIKSLDEKIDIIASSDDDTKLIELEDGIKSLHSKVDVIASSDNEEKIENMVQALHDKVDVLASSEDAELYTEIQDIKGLIVEQRKQIEQFGNTERSVNVGKYLEDLENRLAALDFEKNASDIKDSVMNAILAVADQITFAEETEEIKDFVEERTDEINKNLLDVKKQLNNIACSSDGWDYSYTMQDIESDIAKLRIILNDISSSTSKDEINEISQNMHKIAASVNTLHSTLTEEQILELKTDIEKINSDVISLSSRTNKLLLSSDESYKALTDGLDEFSRVTNQLQKRIDELDNSALSEIIEKKLDNINDAVTSSANSDNIMRQVMLYLGEWIDEASAKLDTISNDTSNLSLVNSELCLLKSKLDDKALIDTVESKFEEQESRIESLERKLEAVLNAVENSGSQNPQINNVMELFDDKINSVDDKMSNLEEKITALNCKLEKLDDKLDKLSKGIEKLASYVD